MPSRNAMRPGHCVEISMRLSTRRCASEAPLPQAMHRQQRRQEGMPELAAQAALMQKHRTIV